MAATDNDETLEQQQSIDGSKKRENSPSLAEATSLRVRRFSEHLEIVSLVGTFSSDGGKHLHMSVSNAKGDVFGGHLIEGTIFTTLELVLGTVDKLSFTREMDEATGYKELSVQSMDF
jgi:predicted DNA-binding protein with PD1-like motif